MARTRIAGGTVHTVPTSLRKIILDDKTIHAVWEDITPLARNEWICWITSAKKAETRNHRMAVMISKMKKGARRPCCWAGCPHRKKQKK